MARETIHFAESEFEVIHYKAVIDAEEESGDVENRETGAGEVQPSQAFTDLMSFENDFCILDESEENIHPLARWYGLREFVVLSPVKSIHNESQIRILLSSIHIAVADSNSEVPVFVQALKRGQNVFLGVCEHRSTRLSFDIVHLCAVPPTCKYLSGVLDLFKGKVNVPYLNPVMVSVRLTYSLAKFYLYAYVLDRQMFYSDYLAFDDDAEEDEAEQSEPIQMKILPFGTSIDPVKELQLFCTWSKVADNVVIDSQTYSDFDPILAPIWSLRAKFETNPVCFASECIGDFLYHFESRIAITEYYPHLVIDVSNEAKPLDRITQSKMPSLLSTLPVSVSSSKLSESKELDRRLDGPIDDNKLMFMLYYLFPDAQPNPQNLYKTPESEPVSLVSLALRVKSGLRIRSFLLTVQPNEN